MILSPPAHRECRSMKSNAPASTDDELNPYEVTANEELPAEPDVSSPSIDIKVLLYVTAAGAILGSVFLAPYVVTVGDPDGGSIGAGLGGLVGLLLTLLAYVLDRWRHPAAAAPTEAGDGPLAGKDRSRRRFLMFVAVRLLFLASWCGVPAYMWWSPNADFVIVASWTLVNVLLVRLWSVRFSRWAEPFVEQHEHKRSPNSHHD